jgi:hypothetical protein
VTINEIEMTLIADIDSMRDLSAFVREDTETIQKSLRDNPRDAMDELVELSEEPWSVIICDTKEPPAGPVTLGKSFKRCLGSSG